ncbi:ROK family protein, partial [Thermanaerothrix sp.]
MAHETVYCIGIDIGGTKISLGVFDSNGLLYGQIQNVPVPFDEKKVADPNRMINLITPFIEDAQNHYSPLIGIGLSICGNVDKHTGEAVLTP